MGKFKECLTTLDGATYKGTASMTKIGIPCQSWNEQEPYFHPYNDISVFSDFAANPDAIMDDVKNYCRNPSVDGSLEIAPWCYPYVKIHNEMQSRQYCNIPRCKGRLRIFGFLITLISVVVFKLVVMGRSNGNAVAKYLPS